VTPQTRTELEQPLKAPIRRGQVVGTLFVRDPEGFEQRVPLVATEDVAESGLLPGAPSHPGNLAMIGGALALGTVFVRGRNRRARFNGTQTARSRSF
jgi:D-alanyl-D-alanine carboxypeptidase